MLLAGGSQLNPCRINIRVHERSSTLALNRLGERDGEVLVQKLAGNAALTPDIVAEIVERTDGVPLFVEELTKAVLESAAPGQPTKLMRPTLALAIAEQIDV